MAELNLSDIGRAKDLFKVSTNSPLANFLIDWANGRIDAMKRDVPKATGGLSQSIAPEYRDGNLTITMDDYYIFVDQGVDGTVRKWGSPYSFKTAKPSKAMVENMKQTKWMAAKGMPLLANQTIDQALYAISTSVKRKGIEPSFFFRDNLTDQMIDQLQNDILEKFGIAIQDIVIRNYERNNN